MTVSRYQDAANRSGGVNMKRWLTLGLVLALSATLNPGAASADVATWRHKECRYQYVDGHGGWSTWEVKLTIRCASDLFGVSLSTALYVADRESNFGQYATNRYSGACGIYQHIQSYWPGRVAKLRSRRPFLEPIGTSCYNARSNVLVSLRMARHSWSPWGM